MSDTPRSVFITGALGLIGMAVIRRLQAEGNYHVTAFDTRALPISEMLPNVTYVVGDVRDAKIVEQIRASAATCVVHLASIVNPGGPARRAFEHSVDVGGTENVLRACTQIGVKQIIVTSSGAAYGYYADNPVPLHESDAVRGNPEFPYADHKRQVEELLANYRSEHPELRQLIFRPGTVLGESTDNQITNLFTGKVVWGIAGFETPFVFIKDDDVANCIVKGIAEESEGIYNLAGDGTLTLRQIAKIVKRPYIPIPAAPFKAVLWTLRTLRVTPHGPEQLKFLQYRPVLANDKLKGEFRYTPSMTSDETFRHFWSAWEKRHHA